MFKNEGGFYNLFIKDSLSEEKQTEDLFDSGNI